MREWTEKHIRELVRAWYGNGSEVTLDPKLGGILTITENFEVHLLGPMTQRINSTKTDVIFTGATLDKIEILNVLNYDAHNTAKTRGPFYQMRIIRITGDFPAFESTGGVILKIPLPCMDNIPPVHSVEFSNGTIEAGPHYLLGAPYLSGYSEFDEDFYGFNVGTGIPVLVDGVYYRGLSPRKVDIDTLSRNAFYEKLPYNGSYGSTVEAKNYRPENNPFGLAGCDRISTVDLDKAAEISIYGTPAFHELIIWAGNIYQEGYIDYEHNGGWTQGSDYSDTQDNHDFTLPQIG